MNTLCILLLSGSVSAFTPPRGPPVRMYSGNTIPTEEFVRDAEKKHGRVALLALPTLGAIAQLTGENPVTYLSNQPVNTQLEFFAIAAAFESLTLRRLGPQFSLKKNVVPGNIYPFSPNAKLDTLEDWAGRCAMLATTAIMLGWLVA